jgi:hypothetical protein
VGAGGRDAAGAVSVAAARSLAEALGHAARRGDADAVDHLVDDLGRRLAELGPGASVDELRSLLALLARTEGALAGARDALRRDLARLGPTEGAALVDGRG